MAVASVAEDAVSEVVVDHMVGNIEATADEAVALELGPRRRVVLAMSLRRHDEFCTAYFLLQALLHRKQCVTKWERWLEQSADLAFAGLTTATCMISWVQSTITVE